MSFENSVLKIYNLLISLGKEKAAQQREKEFKHKLLSWYKENKNKLDLKGSEVEKAYEILLLRCLELNPTEVPIMEKSDKKIVWRSYNRCSTLEACKRAGVDTRYFCKEAYERAIQTLLSKINPRLKFGRNYEKLRPHAEYCEESIELVE